VIQRPLDATVDEAHAHVVSRRHCRGRTIRGDLTLSPCAPAVIAVYCGGPRILPVTISEWRPFDFIDMERCPLPPSLLQCKQNREEGTTNCRFHRFASDSRAPILDFSRSLSSAALAISYLVVARSLRDLIRAARTPMDTNLSHCRATGSRSDPPISKRNYRALATQWPAIHGRYYGRNGVPLRVTICVAIAWENQAFVISENTNPPVFRAIEFAPQRTRRANFRRTSVRESAETFARIKELVR